MTTLALQSAAAPPVYWPMGVYFAAVLAVAAFMIAGSHFLGSRNRDRQNLQPYESGVASTGTARVRLSADFYLFAMFFVIFDLESVFVYSWAVGVRGAGWIGFAQIAFFVASLLAGLVYLWRLGALDSKR